jgi:hypothetical protein
MTADHANEPATRAAIEQHNQRVADTEALRLLLVALADPTPQREASLATMIGALLEAGPTATGNVLGAVIGWATNALTGHHGSQETAVEFVLFALAQTNGAPLLCPLDCIPCPNPQRCIMQSSCHRPNPGPNTSDSPA